MLLKDRVAIVTGGASGLGKAIADRFGAEGAHVVVADLDADAIPVAIEEIEKGGGRASGAQVDVSDRDAVHAAIDDVVGRLGRVDVLVNNAGVTRYRPFLTAEAADWDAVLDVDLKGVFFGAQAVAPVMIRQGSGRIVNISSVAGTGTSAHSAGGSPAGNAAYASAKAAVIQLTKTLARELGPHGINVNCIAPGSFLTAITASTRSEEEIREHTAARSRNAVLGRLGKVEELASAVAFLASAEASFVTGTTLYVDGGRTDRM